MTTTYVPGRFEGRTAVVTGAGAGIGRATAERLLAEEARVVATDVAQDRLDKLAADAGTDRLVTVVGDVADQATIDAVLAAAQGRVDALANVAGVMDGFLPAGEVDDDTWERVMAVNVTGPMRLTRAVLPLMVAAGRGSVVNVGSEAGSRASASGVAYATSKHAVVGFTRSVAFFYTPQGVRANVVAPGAVATSIEAPFRSAFAAERLGPVMAATVPPAATADELAAAITWLLSDDASNVSGAVLHSDGGWAAV